MLKRKRQAETAAQPAPAATNSAAEDSKSKKQKQADTKDVSKYINKQRTLVLSSRGITHRDRHLLSDLRDLLPHSKKDVKYDAKDELAAVNELCEMKNCNNCIFFEARKRKDLYMWVAKAPNGPSVKFQVQNIHTMAEVKLTGNCLKGSRPFLVFDSAFDSAPHLLLMKELLTQALGAPKGHPKVKPFVDHVLSFFWADNRVWFRNYQVVYDLVDPAEAARTSASGASMKAAEKPVLVEIGPRFVLNPIKIFGGSLSGATLWENPHYVSPNSVRAAALAKKASKFDKRVEAQDKAEKWREQNKMEDNPIDSVFLQE